MTTTRNAGRPIRAYYRFAARSIAGEVAALKARRDLDPWSLGLLKARINGWIGRLGMWLTRSFLVSAKPG